MLIGAVLPLFGPSQPAISPRHLSPRCKMSAPEAREEAIKMLVAAQAHLGTKLTDDKMKTYIWRRRTDGINILDIGKTWEKIQVRGLWWQHYDRAGTGNGAPPVCRPLDAIHSQSLEPSSPNCAHAARGPRDRDHREPRGRDRHLRPAICPARGAQVRALHWRAEHRGPLHARYLY